MYQSGLSSFRLVEFWVHKSVGGFGPSWWLRTVGVYGTIDRDSVIVRQQPPPLVSQILHLIYVIPNETRKLTLSISDIHMHNREELRFTLLL